MAGRDAFRFINDLDAATLQTIIKRLEFRGKDPTFVRMRDAYLGKLPGGPEVQILDLGCGTGVVGRALAGRDHFSGRVIGVDQSPALIEAARRFAAEEGVEDHAEFQVGDVQALDYPDGRFHAVIAHTLVSHVADPLAALKEMARVVHPGGTVAIFDGDYASLTFGTQTPRLLKQWMRR